MTQPAACSSLDALPPVAERMAASLDDITALVAAGEPVLLRKLVGSWPIVAIARQGAAALGAYLRAHDRGAPVPVMEAPAASGGRFGYTDDLREYTFTKRQRPLGETLERIARASERDDAAVIAIQMLPLAEQLPGVAAENTMPLVPSATQPKLWLGGKVKTQVHHDRDHNLACVVAGRRRFVLFPPEQFANLYIGPPDRAPPLSLVDPEEPDLARFPRFAEALESARVAHLSPGDALLMPRYWWHHVTSRDCYNAMINYWWGDGRSGIDDPRWLFLAALLTLRDLPFHERAYWQAMFEQHVFADGDDAVAHLPEALRGHLGNLRAADRAALRQQLHAALLASAR